MKKIIIIIQFLFYTTIAFAQVNTVFTNSPLDFYPLNVGDIRHYQYEYHDIYVGRENYYIFEKVLKDTIIDGMYFKKKVKKTFFITRSGEDTLSWVAYLYERIDTLTYKVYEKKIIRDVHYDRTIICLDTQSGDSCMGRECSILYKNLFGSIREVKSFSKHFVYGGVASFDKIEIAANLGITYAYRQPGDVEKTTDLKYALINGTEYGTPIPILEIEDSASIKSHPDNYILYQNYPNPFNSYTTISYYLPSTTDVQIEIYDILGKSVQLLVNEKKIAGIHTVEFDASNLSSGIYMYRLYTENYTQAKKMILIR